METQSKTPLKELPFACSKSELVALYLNQMTEDYILSQINTIIAANRPNVTPSDGSPRVRRITNKEFMEFVAIHGAPKGYAKPIEDQ
ncbi:hypothetical protein [Flavobacterium sp.]|uniref:hypothetical protein n=1 Tax=Flavobacterium sp. TaxID=239 RepID=UPI00403415B3